MNASQTFQRVIRFGLADFWRNGWLSFSASVIVGVTLFTLMVFALQTYVTKSTAENVQNKLDMAVYLTDTPNEDDVSKFVNDIKAYPEVKEVVYLNKDQVLGEWNQLTVDSSIKNQINAQNNPLPRTIKIKAKDPANLDTIAAKINASSFASNIHNLSYKNNGPLIEQLTSQSKNAIRNGFIVGAIFLVISVLFIFNTIRIMVRLRQDEIAIMKLVGATDSFVLGPFLIEGALYGIIGGLLAFVAIDVYLRNNLVGSTAITTLGDAATAGQLSQLFQSHVGWLGLYLVVAGIVLSMLCTWISLRRHLKSA